MSIEVNHIHKTFGTYHALKDVSLKINDGELVALLGPSGSGKTTLLRIIAGLETPDDDPRTSIRFHNEDVAGRPVGEREVGFVFQHYALFRHLNVFENIAFGLRVRPRSQRPARHLIRDRVLHLLDLVQLTGFGSRFPSQLSGGQRQRVALARALAVEPRVLLLDEPFGALDAQVRKGLRAWLRKLHEEIHVTSVLVTHDQEEALSLADEVAVMMDGRVVQTAPPSQLYHYPASQAVAGFVGEANFLPGQADGDRVDCALGRLPLDKPAYGSVTVMVRPEWLRLNRGDSQAVITWREFYGHDQRIGIRLHDDTKLVVRSDAGEDYTVGESVGVTVPVTVRSFPINL